MEENEINRNESDHMCDWCGDNPSCEEVEYLENDDDEFFTKSDLCEDCLSDFYSDEV